MQCSEKRQTVFAMYNQELNRDQVAPSYQKNENDGKTTY